MIMEAEDARIMHIPGRVDCGYYVWPGVRYYFYRVPAEEAHSWPDLNQRYGVIDNGAQVTDVVGAISLLHNICMA